MIGRSLGKKLGLLGLSLGCAVGVSGPLEAALVRSPICRDGDCEILSLKDDVEQLVALSWGDIWRWIKPKRGSGTIRTHVMQEKPGCMIVPGKLFHDDKTQAMAVEQAMLAMSPKSTSIKVWNPRPLFLWEGQWDLIEVYAYGEESPIWRMSLEPDQQHLLYDGDAPLEWNQNGYYWQLTATKEAVNDKTPKTVESESFRKAFRMMKPEESEPITQALDSLMQQLEADSATPERIATSRAQFFLDRDLGTDLFQEIYKSSTLFAELKNKKQDFCPDKSEEGENVDSMG